MFSGQVRTLAVTLLAFIASTSFALPAPSHFDQQSVRLVVDSFFQLFTADCQRWTSIFEPHATFYHPSAGTITKKSVTQNVLFRQDGSLKYTLDTMTGKVRVLSPYVFATVFSQGDGKEFINSGYEFFELVKGPDGSYKIAAVTEIFNKNSLDFEYPAN
jgi:hypothetical protein